MSSASNSLEDDPSSLSGLESTLRSAQAPSQSAAKATSTDIRLAIAVIELLLQVVANLLLRRWKLPDPNRVKPFAKWRVANARPGGVQIGERDGRPEDVCPLAVDVGARPQAR